MKHGRIAQGAGLAAIGVVGWLAFVSPALAGSVAAQTPPPTTPTPPDINTLLAPMLFAATAIERVLEMAWNFFESGALQVAATVALGGDWARYAHTQVLAAEGAMRELTRQVTPPPAAHATMPAGGPAPAPAAGPAAPVAPGPTLEARITEAEKNLINAQATMRSALDSDRYKSTKQAVSVLAGLVIGMFITVSTGLDIFKLLDPNRSASLFGELVTGLIVGAGTGPVHSIIGLLQQSRDAVDQAANLFNSRAAQNNARTLTNPAGLESAPPTPASALEGAAPLNPAAPTPVSPVVITAADALALKQLARR